MEGGTREDDFWKGGRVEVAEVISYCGVLGRFVRGLDRGVVGGWFGWGMGLVEVW